MKQLGLEKVRLESLLLEVRANVGEEGKLFGSVTVAQVAELIAAKGIELDRRKIQLEEPIKEIGEHVVPVRLHKDVVASLKVRVIASE
jgi:large subunit ribosomal protein L9